MKYVMLFATTFMIISCGQQSGGTGGSAGGPGFQLKPNDLEPSSKLKAETDYSVVNDFLLDDSSFFANKPEPPESANSSNSNNLGQANQSSDPAANKISQCADDILKGIKVSSTEDMISFYGSIDICPCARELSKSFEGAGLKVTTELVECSSSINFAAKFRCTGGKFSRFNGKSLKDLLNEASTQGNSQVGLFPEGSCPKVGTREEQSNSQSDIRMVTKTTSKDKATRFEFETKSLLAVRQAGGEPCVQNHSKEYIKLSPCLKISRTIKVTEKIDGKDLEGAGMEDYSKIEFNRLIKRNDSTSLWYESGKIDFQKNSWKGIVTYRGAEKDPPYEMTNGSETKKGQLNLSSRAGEQSQEQTGYNPKNIVFNGLIGGYLERVISRK